MFTSLLNESLDPDGGAESMINGSVHRSMVIVMDNNLEYSAHLC